MKATRSFFFDIHDWKIIDNKICHFYNENETPFAAICVVVGYYTVDTIDFNNHIHTEKYDIIRWISSNEYARLLKNEGIIIW